MLTQSCALLQFLIHLMKVALKATHYFVLSRNLTEWLLLQIPSAAFIFTSKNRKLTGTHLGETKEKRSH